MSQTIGDDDPAVVRDLTKEVEAEAAAAVERCVLVMSNGTGDGEPAVVNYWDDMPVCLAGNRLEFTTRTILRGYILGMIRLDADESVGGSYDGASIPRWAWSIIGHPLQEEFRWASYWHDRLCERAHTWSQRRLADAVLLTLLEIDEVGYLRRTAMWLAVRLYAWFVWSWRRRR